MENGSAPAASKFVEDLASRWERKIDARERRILDKVGELVHDAETRLLGAFYTFAESNQKRLSAVEMESAALKSRLSSIEDRLFNVEKRLNMPPQ